MSGKIISPGADRSAVHGMIEKLPELVNHDAALLRRGRYLDLDVLIEIGDVPYYVSIENGRIARLDRGPLLMRSWALAFRGADDAWRQFWQPFPPPHFHDIFAHGNRNGAAVAAAPLVGTWYHQALLFPLCITDAHPSRLRKSRARGCKAHDNAI